MNLEFITSLDFSVVWQYRTALLKGLGLTLVYFAIAAASGIAGACVLVAANRSRFRPVRWLAVCFIELFRNTPLFVQLIWFHFALPAFTGIDLSLFQSSALALSFNASAYMSEIVRAGIDSVPRGQWEACFSLGLRPFVTWTRVILPQAVRLILPPLSGLMVSLLKGTSILSILSVAELMRATTRISTHTARPIEMYTASAMIYFLIGLMILKAFSLLEKRVALKGN